MRAFVASCIIALVVLMGIAAWQHSASADGVGIITTVAGNGQVKYAGDGGPATQASLNWPTDVAISPGGSLYIADSWNKRIRRIDPRGIITTVAGGGHPSEGVGDGGPATKASLNLPQGLALGPDKSIYIADLRDERIRKVAPGGNITTVAGGDEHDLSFPHDVAVAPDGTVYIADTNNHRIMEVTAAGVLRPAAGNRPKGFGYSGDGGPAVQAQLYQPMGVAVGPGGILYIADTFNHRVRKVDAAGIITTMAGDGWKDSAGHGRYAGDGGPAVDASLWEPVDVALGPDGSLYIADKLNHRIRKVRPDGIITTVAGNGEKDFFGDGGVATRAALNEPMGVAVSPDGTLYIADHRNHRIRKVTFKP